MSIEGRAKKVFAFLLVWFVILGIVAGAFYLYKCKGKGKLQKETGSQSHYKEEVSVLADAFSGYCILRSAAMKENLMAEGVKLVVVDDKADYLGRMKTLRDGKADMAVFTVDSMLTAGAKVGEFPVSIVMVIDKTRGADAVVAYKSAVPSIQELNKPNAGFVATPNSPSEFLSRVVLADFNLPLMPQKWLIPAEGAAEVLAKLKQAARNEPKAYVLWEPYVSKALAIPGTHVLIASDKLDDYIVDVLVVRRQVIKEKPELVTKVVMAYLRAAYSYSQDMAGLVIEDAKQAGESLSRGEAENVTKGIVWKNTLENYAHFRMLSSQESKGLLDMETIISNVTRVLVMTGAIGKDELKAQPNELFYDKILSGMKAANFHPAKKLGLVAGAGSSESMGEVRAEAELPELSEQEWEKLVAVGQMRVPSIEFKRGTSDLGIQGKRDLEEMANVLKTMPQYYLTVIGHARAEGDPEANMQLAKERSTIAAEYFVLRMGISRSRVRATAMKPSISDGSSQSVTFQLGQKPY